MRRDRLLVNGLTFVGPHGYYAHEREEGRRFRVDLAVELSTARPGGSDALADTVDYRAFAEIVLEVGHGPSHKLIESMAEQMCALILARHPVEAVELRLIKYADGVPGAPESVGIEIRREQERAG